VKRILVAGGSGLLGGACCVHFSENFETFFSFHDHGVKIKGCNGWKVDLSNERQAQKFVQKVNPDAIINTVALTNLELCEEKPLLAEKVNVETARNTAIAAKDNGSKLIHISTNYVFDGERGNYSEEDTPKAAGVYSCTKIEGDEAVLAVKPEYNIVRTCIFGWNIVPERKNSVSWIYDALSRGQKISALTDQYMNIILANSLAENLELLVNSPKQGIYNISAHGSLSKFELASRVAELYGFDKSLIGKSTLKEFYDKGIFKAKRPRDGSLTIQKFEKEFKVKLPSMDEDLAKFRKLGEQNYLSNFKLASPSRQ